MIWVKGAVIPDEDLTIPASVTRTNVGFFRQIFEDQEFRAGHLHTGFIDEFFARQRLVEPPRELAAVAALAAALHDGTPDVDPTPDGATSPWVTIGRQELLR